MGPEARIAPPRPSTLDPVSALPFVEDDGRREPLGVTRGIVVSFIVALAAGLVVASCVAILRSVDSSNPDSPDAGIAAAAASHEAVADATAAAPSTPPTSAPAQPPSASAQPVAATAPPVRATGRAAEPDRSLSFAVDTAQLRAGEGYSVTVSGTGPAADRVARVEVSIADGTSLASGEATGCEGPAFPWSQDFAITFPAAESTQLRVQLTTCAGRTLTATSLVDIQP